MGRWEEGWGDLRTGVKGRRSSWIGGSEEPLFSSEAFPCVEKKLGNGSLLGLSRKEKGNFGVSPKLKPSSILLLQSTMFVIYEVVGRIQVITLEFWIRKQWECKLKWSYETLYKKKKKGIIGFYLWCLKKGFWFVG